MKKTLDSYSKKALYCHMTTGRKIMDWKLIGYRVGEFLTFMWILFVFVVLLIVGNI